MEILYLSIPLISCLFCLIFSFSYLFYSKRKSSGDDDVQLMINLPPGTTGWPIIGETLAYINTHRKGVTEKFYEDRFQKYSKIIFRTSLFGEPFAVLHGAVGNKFVLTNQDKLLLPWWPKSILRILSPVIRSSINEQSKEERKLILKSLSAESLQRFTGTIDEEAKKHFDTHWENREEVFVVSLVKSYIVSLGCRLFVNIDDPFQTKEIGELVEDIMFGLASLPINLPGGKFTRARKAVTILRDKLAAIVKQRKIELFEKKTPPIFQDILSRLLLGSDEDERFMDEVDITTQIVGLFLGAIESTSSTLSHVVKYLPEYPHVYNKVLEEQMEITKSKAPGELLSWKDIQKMKYLWNVVCETLRLTPPTSGTFRIATTDINYQGFTIPKGWKVPWSVSWTHMNPNYFPEPKKFDPSRFEGNGPAPYTFVPFGGGSRMCPGKEYVRLATLVFMHNAVIRYKWEKIIPDENTIIKHGIPTPAKGLPVRLQKVLTSMSL